MTLRERVPLSSLTTLRAGGEAALVADCATEGEVGEALALARARGLPWYVLGDGSNVLAADAGFEGLIVRPRLMELSFEDAGDLVRLTAGAGVGWDALVREAAARGLWGVENLAGIPGTVGAAPVQNIGAYGAELADTLEFVDAYDAERGSVFRFTKAECAFGYRDSRFKKDRGLVIVRAAFLLARAGSARDAYADLKKAREAGADLSTPGLVGEAVRAIRARKFPDLAVHGTAGSFFKNPVIPQEAFDALQAAFPELPGFPGARGVKVPLAFVLDRILSLRGHRAGKAWLFSAQPLVVVLDDGGTAGDVEALASDVAARVREATGIEIEREVRSLPEK